MIADFGAGKDHFYIVPDYIDSADSQRLVELFGNWPLLTGGSGLMVDLARKLAAQTDKEILESGTAGPALLLAGSCSIATLEQIKNFQQTGGLSVKLDPTAIMSGSQTLENLVQFIDDHRGDNILFYSSEEPENLKQNQEAYGIEIAAVLEKLTAELALAGNERDYNRLIIAGGETSGAVARSLNFKAYQIGESVAPGVPIMVPLNNKKVRLVLKSGNFGQPDFFAQALHLTKKEI